MPLSTATGLLALCTLLPSASIAEPAMNAAAVGLTRDQAAAALLAEAFPDGLEGQPSGGRDLFTAAMQSEAFVHEAVGPFDVYVYVADGLKKTRSARKIAEKAAKGLASLVPVMESNFGREGGLISGQRFPIVLADADLSKGETAFDHVLALLDRCEEGSFSGFKADLAVWNSPNRALPAFFTWEVQLINLGHGDITQQGKSWLEHGLGYHAINLVVNRMFARGAWGPPPPWLMNGLVDELDIQAYGEAWVAAGESNSWSSSTSGWSRSGWSGFVPKGSSPPPPVMGPPPNLSTKFSSAVSSDQWIGRKKSGTRHWTALAADLDSEAPVSLRLMAAGQSFESRDRAYSRCVLHLMLDLVPMQDRDLLSALDTESRVTRTGMRDGDPLPVVVARVLGGVPAVDEVEALTMQELLISIKRTDLIESITRLGGAGMLSIKDHRQQADWLYSQYAFDDRTRLALYLKIAEIENYQQLREWELLGDVLDRAAGAALEASSGYPKKAKSAKQIGEAFRGALSG
jgi:hypothetical protein